MTRPWLPLQASQRPLEASGRGSRLQNALGSSVFLLGWSLEKPHARAPKAYIRYNTTGTPFSAWLVSHGFPNYPPLYYAPKVPAELSLFRAIERERRPIKKEPRGGVVWRAVVGEPMRQGQGILCRPSFKELFHPRLIRKLHKMPTSGRLQLHPAELEVQFSERLNALLHHIILHCSIVCCTMNYMKPYQILL